MEEPNYRRMQVKVLYLFNNNPTVFLSRSKAQYSVKVAQIPLNQMSDQGEEATLTLGAFELSQCIQQILKCSPENFKLQTEDYVVYYKDVTEQPDEPFVSNGVLSSLMADSKSVLVPGRVCQNVSASYLFGDKNSSPSLTLDVRLKLHTIERALPHEPSQKSTQPETQTSNKRPGDAFVNPLKKSKIKPLSASCSSSNAAIKATRTKSLPIFYYPHNQQIFNIMNADKANVPSRYDSKSVQERFKLAPFLQAKVIDNPSSQKKQMKRFAKISNNLGEPQRAMRTRSMMTRRPATLPESSPIQEEPENDGSDDSDYNENADTVENENNGVSSDEMTPYSPQQAEYPAANSSNSSSHQFQALPDMEDLDSKKIHTIPHNKLPSNHDLTCINSNCATTSSISWRYFETSFHPNYLALHRATEFDKLNYEGMFGPLCNACYLFLRNKGFMRPEGVVKKYLQQQKYKKDLKQKDEHGSNPENQLQYKSTIPHTDSYRQSNMERNLGNRNSDHSENFSSSPISSHGRFLTPAHTPALINQAIQNSSGGHNRLNKERYEDSSLHYNELNEFMNQLNSFGGPLTDIDPLPQEQNTGLTPPMMATKSNTRVIDLYDDGEDKENCPPVAKTVQEVNTQSSNKAAMTDIEKMMAKTFHEYPDNSGTMQQGDIWLNDFFSEPTPRDTPSDFKHKMKGSNQSKSGNGMKYSEDTESEKEEAKSPQLPCLRTFTHNKSDSPNTTKDIVSNMPSSPFLSHNNNQDQSKTLSYNNSNRYISGGHVSSDQVSHLGDHQDRMNVSSPSKASRYDTTFSWNMNSNVDDMKQNTPNSELYSNDDPKIVSQARSDQPAKNVSSS